MSDWYDAAKAYFNSVTGESHQAFADAARAFYKSGGDGAALADLEARVKALEDAE